MYICIYMYICIAEMHRIQMNTIMRLGLSLMWWCFILNEDVLMMSTVPHSWHQMKAPFIGNARTGPKHGMVHINYRQWFHQSSMNNHYMNFTIIPFINNHYESLYESLNKSLYEEPNHFGTWNWDPTTQFQNTYYLLELDSIFESLYRYHPLLISIWITISITIWITIWRVHITITLSFYRGFPMGISVAPVSSGPV